MPIDRPYAYHKPSPAGFEKIQALRAAFSDVERVIRAQCPESRQRSVAITELETAAMWAIKSIVFNDPNSVVDPGLDAPVTVTTGTSLPPTMG